MRERFREAPRALFDVSGDAFGYRFRSKRGVREGTTSPKTDKAIKKTSDGEPTTIIFSKFKNIDISVLRKCALSDARSPERAEERTEQQATNFFRCTDNSDRLRRPFWF